MSDNRTVSEVIPANDVEALVAEALDSVERQTSRGIASTVVDIGSTRGTGSFLSDRVAARNRPERMFRLVRQANTGATTARNRGPDLATDALVAFLDADDRLYPDGLTRLVGPSTQRPTST